jgi:hypothetical protein
MLRCTRSILISILLHALHYSFLCKRPLNKAYTPIFGKSTAAKCCRQPMLNGLFRLELLAAQTITLPPRSQAPTAMRLPSGRWISVTVITDASHETSECSPLAAVTLPGTEPRQESTGTSAVAYILSFRHARSSTHPVSG